MYWKILENNHVFVYKFHPCVFCWHESYCCKNMSGEFTWPVGPFSCKTLFLNKCVHNRPFLVFTAGHSGARIYLWSGSGSVWRGKGCLWRKRVLACYSGRKGTKILRTWVFSQTVGFRWDNAKVFMLAWNSNFNNVKYMICTRIVQCCHICHGLHVNNVNNFLFNWTI